MANGIKIECTNLGEELLNSQENDSTRSFTSNLDNIEEANVQFEIEPSEHRVILREFLNNSPMNKFQCDAIENIVFRPSFIRVKKTVSRRQYRYSTTEVVNPKKHTVDDYVDFSKHNDIGVVVVNDLLPGTGKTMVTMLACIYFSVKRRRDIIKRHDILFREQRSNNWCSRLGYRDTKCNYTNAVVVMAPHELAPKWEKAATDAIKLLSLEDTCVYRNPTKEYFDPSPGDVSVLVFTSVACMVCFFEGDDGFIPCMIVDEYVSKDIHNPVPRNPESLPIFGRMVLVSANAGNTSNIVSGSRKNSLIRMITSEGVYDNTTLRGDVFSSATLLSCSILDSNGKSEVKKYMARRLENIRLFRYSLPFRSSTWKEHFPERGHENLDLLRLDGYESVRTIGDLRSKIAQHACDKEDTLSRILNKLDKFVSDGDNCPICLDGFNATKNVCMVRPCWHFVCERCMNLCLRSRTTCPMCREEITGISDFLPDQNVYPKILANDDDSFDDRLRAYVGLNGNSSQCCAAIVKSMSWLDRPTNIFVISPYPGFHEELRASLDSADIRVKDIGTRKRKKSVVVEERVNWFKQGIGGGVKVLCAHDCRDIEFIGDDLSDIDAVCNIGGDPLYLNSLGLLTRVPYILGKGVRNIRIFNLVPDC